VRFTSGRADHSGAAGGAFRNGLNQQPYQQQPPQRNGSFQAQFGYQSGGGGGGSRRTPHVGGMAAPQSVAFPAGFNPNAAPSDAAPVSKYRTTFEAPPNDVPVS